MDAEKRLNALRAEMAARHIDGYLITSDDFHGSEYVGAYFMARAYLSGFTGSAGTLAVLPDRAALWTDGRYFLQAEQQLAGSGIDLMRAGEKGTPTVACYLREHLPSGGTLGFDGRCVSHAFVNNLRRGLEGTGIGFETAEDLVGVIWRDRPPLPQHPIWELPAADAGETRKEKLARVRRAMADAGADSLVLTALDDIAWLLNLRGGDVACTPVFLSFMLVTQADATLCVQRDALGDDIFAALCGAGVTVAPYEEIYRLIGRLPTGSHLLLDGRTASRRIFDSIPTGVSVIDRPSVVARMKACKTPAEQRNMRMAHHKDGIALTRFLYWLKHRGEDRITELDAAAALERLRAEQPGYLGSSFEPIVAYGAHAAIVHYAPTEQSNAVLGRRGFCLLDTGGHYREGTTDVTRTVALGPLTEQEKQIYTLVLRGHLALGAAHFPHGICGEDLDCLARAPLWEKGLDYAHGTGHGVGYLLSVHEEPQRITRRRAGAVGATPLEEGMVLSDEPGFYAAGQFGVRLENLMMVCRDSAEEPSYLHFEMLTAAPFDPDAILPEQMSDRELAWLNAYHEWVFRTLSPHLPTEEAAWLRCVTSPLSK